MKKIYNDNDEVEIRLKYYVNHTFVLEWRFKEPGRFLFFKVPDKWRRILLYDNPRFSPYEDPDKDIYWSYVFFNLGWDSEVQKYERLKEKVKTKKELDNYFHVKEKMSLYQEHKKRHQEWVEKTNKTIDRLTKA